MADFNPELISAYLDAELSRDEQARVEEWLAESEEARQVLERLRAVSGAVRSLPRAGLGERFAAEVLQAIGRHEVAASAREDSRQTGHGAPLGVVGAGTEDAAGNKAPSEAVDMASPTVRAGGPVGRHWRWMVPAGGIAASVLIALWIAQQGAGPEQVARLTEGRATPSTIAARAPEGEAAVELHERSPQPSRSAEARSFMSKAAAEPAPEAALELESAPKGGLGGGGLDEGALGADRRGRNDELAARDEALATDVPLVQSVAQLNPHLTVDSIDRMGAAVVIVSGGDHRAGMAALQHALSRNAILTDPPAEEQPAAEAPEPVREMAEKSVGTDKNAPEDADGLYVIANADQLRGALRSLKEGPSSASIERITLRVVRPELFQRELATQLSLTHEAPPPEAAAGDRAQQRPDDAQRSADTSEPDAMRLQQRRVEPRPLDRSRFARGAEPAAQFGRQIRVKWRGAGQDGQLQADGWQKVPSRSAEPLEQPARGGATVRERLGSKSPEDGASSGKAGAARENAAARPATAPSLSRRSVAERQAEGAQALSSAAPAQGKQLQVLFLFESTPAAAKPAPRRADPP